MLYDTAGMDKGGVEERGSAAILEGTQLCRTCQLRDILHCLGGVAILLPLFSQLGGGLTTLGMSSLRRSSATASSCAKPASVADIL